MNRIRVIPVLLLRNGGLYKSIQFRKHKYIGDPINAVRIFNEKEVDEIIVLDIAATAEGLSPNVLQIREIASEAFMPLAYGGGINSVEVAKRILYEGVEKVVLNAAAIFNPGLIGDLAKTFGSSSVVVSVDVKKNWLGKRRVYTSNGTKNTGQDPVLLAQRMEQLGAGEIFLNLIDRDGTYKGYDIELVKKVSQNISIPVIICGGASTIEDFEIARQAGASAVAAGSMFVFQRPHNAVLISYPDQEILQKELYRKNT